MTRSKRRNLVGERRQYAVHYRAIARSGTYNDHPGKIETTAWGEVMREPPPSIRHKWYQNRILELLNRAITGGEAATEFPVATAGGTKLPDVAWVSYETWEEAVADEMALPVPKVCVEVLSLSNTAMEMEEKKRLYLEIGVEEVWICEQDGTLRFYDESGRISTSKIVNDVPDQISSDIRG